MLLDTCGIFDISSKKKKNFSENTEKIVELGADITKSNKGNIYTLTIIGQIEGLTYCGKTGTAQQSNTHADHVLFVGFAPSNEPEIAFSCRIANGSSYLR